MNLSCRMPALASVGRDQGNTHNQNESGVKDGTRETNEYLDLDEWPAFREPWLRLIAARGLVTNGSNPGTGKRATDFLNAGDMKFQCRLRQSKI
jgi:hypothetical protein